MRPWNKTGLVPAIVLTGTIVPNTTYVSLTNAEARRKEYLRALHYYVSFGVVYFLENSEYPLLDDAEFTSIPGVVIRKFPPSIHHSKGKGFQEFEMLSAWLTSEQEKPASFIKVTGRIIVENFMKIRNECLQGEGAASIIIDQYPVKKLADTRMFFVATDFYIEQLRDLFKDCNDDTGDWAEFVMFRYLDRSDFTILRFKETPKYSGVSGSTGGDYKLSPTKYAVKCVIRRLSYLFSRKYVYL